MLSKNSAKTEKHSATLDLAVSCIKRILNRYEMDRR